MIACVIKFYVKRQDHGIVMGLQSLNAMTMKKLEEMGLVPLTKKECVEQNGGNSTIPPVKLPDI